MTDSNSPSDRLRKRREATIPNYQNRSTKLRIFTLVAMLILVLAVAERAANPKSWNWLFDLDKREAPAAEREIVNRLTPKPLLTESDPAGTFVSPTKETETAELLASSDKQEEVRAGNDDDEANGKDDDEDKGNAGGATNSAETSATENASSDTPASTSLVVKIGLDERPREPVERAWYDAWRTIYVQLEPEQRTTLFDALRACEKRAAGSAELHAKTKAVSTLIRQMWTDYHASAFTAVGELQSDDQARWIDVLRQVGDRLEKNELLTIENWAQSKAPNSEEQANLRRLSTVLEHITLGMVEDDTVFRPIEREIWFRILEKLEQIPAAEFAKASRGRIAYLQIYDQSADYRGQVIEVKGTARMAYHVRAQKNDLGIEGYYVFVVHPDGGPDSPILVYTLETPPGFPEIKDRDLDGEHTKLHEPVEFTGYFFKRFAYLGKDGTYSAPLVVARTPIWDSSPSVARAALRAPIDTSSLLTIIAISLGASLLIVAWMLRWLSKQREVHTVQIDENVDLSPISQWQLHPSPRESLGQMADAARRDTGARPASDSSSPPATDNDAS